MGVKGSMQADCVVLGAGIVGVSIAIHLAERGKSVVLLDRKKPGQETSYGNAGLIQREGVAPYFFPQDLGTIARHARNGSADSSYHPMALPKIAPFLARYWWNSRPSNYAKIQRLYEPLIRHCITEHSALIDKAGAGDLIHKSGWTKAFRTKAGFDAATADAERLNGEFGVNFRRLDGDALLDKEPALRQPMAGAVHWTDPWSILDPESLVKAYVALFEKLGGTLATGDATTLAQSADGAGWSVLTDAGRLEVEEAVVALGPWADLLTRPLGYDLPLAVKRGYHMHYRMEGNAALSAPLMDAEVGYMMAPMLRGLRITTGAEFAERDAPQTPVQLERVEKAAKELIPLGERVDPHPWMGARPCTPDMMPIIGPAPRHKNLWFAFGHAHHGMTLGPVTGRLLAEQMLGEKPFIDPEPYWATRFGR
jgi:D-amino-acid dehydrogenase